MKYPKYPIASLLTSLLAALTLTLPVSADEAPAEPDKPPVGWFTDENEKTFFYTDQGVKLTGLNVVDGDTYLFAPNGAVKNGWFTVDGVRMFFDLDTGKKQVGWISYMGNTFYSDPQTGKLTGLNLIDGKNFMFDENGILQQGWFEYEGSKYYSDMENGVYTGKQTIGGITYLFSDTGRFRSGWQTVDGLRVFYDYDTARPLYGWINYNGLIYYADPNSGKFTGDQIIEKNLYRFNEKGFLETGMQEFYDGTRFYYEDGTPGKGLIKYNGNSYFFGEDFLMKKGFVTIDNDTFFFGDDGAMLLGWQNIGVNRYYFGSDGKMVRGLNKIEGFSYFFNDDGAMQKGFIQIKNDTFYFDSEGKMLLGMQSIDGKKYYFGRDGAMAVGFVSLDGKLYLFSENGFGLTGWQTVNGKKYHLTPDCFCHTGICSVDGKKYYFDPKNGTLICGTTLNGVTTASDGTVLKVMLGTPYLSQEGYPTGCESASAVMLLRDAGYNTSIDTFIDEALDIDWLYSADGVLYGPDPNESFIGDPRSEYGYGCYAPVITKALNRLLKNGDRAVNITGAALGTIITEYIDKGIPAAIWATINMIETEPGTEWIIPSTGELYTWKSHEHCLVLVGYDKDFYYINDPYKSNGLKAYSRPVVDERFASMGYQAVVILKQQTDT